MTYYLVSKIQSPLMNKGHSDCVGLNINKYDPLGCWDIIFSISVSVKMRNQAQKIYIYLT